MRLALLRPRAAVLVGALAALILSGCDSSAPAAKEKKIEVVVTTPIHEQVVDFQDFTGRMDAYRTVEIRVRVTGYVNSAPFKEGDWVNADDVLFEIDPRPYQAIVDQAVAEVATRKAQTEKAEAMYRRSLALLPNKISTQEDVDNQKGDWDVARANILLSDAKLRDARLNLSFCKVIAPHQGRISRRFVDPGNLVRADDSILTTLVLDDKVYAYFDVDERSYLDLVGEQPSAQANARLMEKKLPVVMRLANSDDFTYDGKGWSRNNVIACATIALQNQPLAAIACSSYFSTIPKYDGYVDFVDNRLNGNTGTIRFRGVFENPRDTFKSGLFVRVRLPIGKPYSALLISDEAILSDQGRKYVYVVKTDADNKEVVEYRPVVLGQAVQSLRAINPAKIDSNGKVTEGLLDGERVIISGMQRVHPGTVVTVKLDAPPKPPGFPMGKLLNLPAPGDKETRRQGDKETRRQGD